MAKSILFSFIRYVYFHETWQEAWHQRRSISNKCWIAYTTNFLGKSKYPVYCYIKNAVFWDVAPCRSCVSWRFGGTFRLHLQGRKIRERGSTWCHIPEDGILHSHCLENLKSYILLYNSKICTMIRLWKICVSVKPFVPEIDIYMAPA
jgi:hypothetical protein